MIATPVLSFANSIKNKSVGMWVMMLWFNDNNYRPWEQYVRYYPKNKKHYNSWDTEHIDYTLSTAEKMGVDYLILDNTNGVFRHNGNFDKTIKAYLDRIKLKKSKIKVSIATGYEIYEKKDFNLFNNSINHLSQYFSDENYYHIDEKPLLILYVNPDDNIFNLSKIKETKANITSQDKLGFRDFFKNYTIRYASGSNTWITDEYGIYGWKCDATKDNLSHMCVMPGWNRSHNTLTGSTPTERNNGEFYRESWDKIIKINPNSVSITSWDDWAEETAIAPSEEWGSTYVDITQEMIQRYKQ